MAGVPSALVARNASWVRKQAQSFVRHLPANVEKADLIQAGLIAVAQAALHFEWPDGPETIVMRRLEAFFARLPERERQVIDAYLGVGLSPVDLAASVKVTPSRVAQIYGRVVKRLAVHFGHAPHQRATDQLPVTQLALDDLVAQRQAALKASPESHAWDARIEAVLMSPAERFGIHTDVPEGTRW